MTINENISLIISWMFVCVLDGCKCICIHLCLYGRQNTSQGRNTWQCPKITIRMSHSKKWQLVRYHLNNLFLFSIQNNYQRSLLSGVSVVASFRFHSYPFPVLLHILPHLCFLPSFVILLRTMLPYSSLIIDYFRIEAANFSLFKSWFSKFTY